MSTTHDDYERLTCFADLPEHLCSCIFSRLTRRQKASMRQTCSRFRKIVNATSRSLVLDSVPATSQHVADAGFDNLRSLTLSPDAWWSPEVVTALLKDVGQSARVLETLDLRGSLQLSVDTVHQLQHLPNLRDLHLPDSCHRDEGWTQLSQLTNLTHLAVNSSDCTLELATQLPSLQLITPFPPLDSSQAEFLLPHLLQLTSVTIRAVSVECPNLCSLLVLPHLQALHLFSNSVALPVLTLKCWQQICDLPTLKQLELDGFVMEHLPPGRMASASNPSAGQSGSFTSTGWISGGEQLGYGTARRKRGSPMANMCVKDCLDPFNLLFPGWLGLQALSLNECLFSSAQLEQLGNLSQLVGLTRLDLTCVWRGSGLLAEWLGGLTPRTVPPNLQELSLKSCGLLGVSLLLGCFRHFVRLQRLDVEENCLLTEKFFSGLSQLSPLRQLRQLRVRCSRLTPSVLPAFFSSAAAMWPQLELDVGHVVLEKPGDVGLCLLALSTLSPVHRLSTFIEFVHFLDIDDTVLRDLQALTGITPLTSLSLSFASEYIFQRAGPVLGDLIRLPDLDQITLLVPPRNLQGAWVACQPLMHAGVKVQVQTV